MFNPFSVKAEQDIIIPAILRNQTNTPEVQEANKRIWIKVGIRWGIGIAAMIALRLWANSVDKKYPLED